MSTNYPQGPQGQPTNPFVQPQPPKKKHTLRNLLIGGGVLMALVVGGCSAALAGGADDTTGAAVAAKPAASAPAQVEKPADKPAEKKAEKPKSEEPKAEKAEPKEEKESKPKVVKVSAGKLIKAFEDNELKADAKYKGKTLKVTGVVDKVDTELLNDEKYILNVDDGDEWSFLTVSFYDIPTDELSDLDAGDKVTVIGEFSDGGDLGVTIKNAHVKS